MYADTITDAMQAVINENTMNRNIQEAYNQEYGVVSKQIASKRTREERIPEKKEDKKVFK